MKRTELKTILMTLALATSAPSIAGEEPGIVETVGTAFDLENGKLKYQETHCVGRETGTRQVTYESGDGSLIAHKLVDYQTGMTTPSYVQQNIQVKQSLKVDFRSDAVTITLVDNESRSEKVTRAKLDQNLPVVVDAGFDSFIQQNWDDLVSGKNQEFQFPLAARSTLVELRLSPRTCSYDTDSEQCFRLDLDNWLLRMLMKPIELGYDKSSKRLTRYRGLANIEDKKGNGMVVDIQYQYQDKTPVQCVINDHKSYAADMKVVLNTIAGEK